MNKKTRIAFYTLGCKVNQYETESLQGKFIEKGYTIVDFDDTAEVYIINSCTVTQKADRKSRNAIYRALRHAETKHIDASIMTILPHVHPLMQSQAQKKLPKCGFVFVTGCYVHSTACHDIVDNRIHWVKNEHKSSLCEIVDAYIRGEIFDNIVLKEDVFNYNAPRYGAVNTRRTIKIQDGCDNFCTFCIIPQVRGHAQSRPVSDIIEEIKQSIDYGYKELVITGINMSRYEYDNINFSHMLEKILEIQGDFRVRISSLEPDHLDEHFFALLQHEKCMPYLHLCAQSGSDKILLQMRRQYRVRDYMHMIERIRKCNEQFHIGTDMIVGFPGETHTDHMANIALIQNANIGNTHVFPYAKRYNTRAQRMDNHVVESIKKERVMHLTAIAQKQKVHYWQQFMGYTEELLIEKCVQNSVQLYTISGFGKYYIPIHVHNMHKKQCNTIEKVRIHTVDNDTLLGNML